MTEYKIREDNLVSEDNIKYKAYGMDICVDEKTIESIKDISLEKEPLEKFIHKCNNLKLSIMQVVKAIEDYVDR